MRIYVHRLLLGLAVPGLLWLLAATPVAAQHIIIEPPFPPEPPLMPFPPGPGPIQVDDYKVEARIDGPAAQVRVTQLFHNQTGQTVEGQFVFPLPADAVVSDLQMRIDGEVLEGRLLPSQEARAIYEAIVRQQRDPALLQYLGQGLFQTNVFPIPPGATRAIQFQYTHVLAQADGLYHFRFPLRAQPVAQGQAAAFQLEVELVNQPGLRTLYSPNHATQIERTGDAGARVTLEGTAATTDPAFDLFWGVSDEAIGLNVLSYRPAGEDGFFVLLASPELDTAESQVVARDVVLVLDVSGSMEGEKMLQARKAVDYVVDHLNREDRFSIVSFSTGVRLWSNHLEDATVENVADAREWIGRLEAGGSTDINRALLEALALVAETSAEQPARPAYILFMTDGLPTQGETDPWHILDNALANAPQGRMVRLFTFGVGFDVNTQLLDTLSQELAGRSSYVLPEERIDEAVSQFYQGIRTPVLTDVAIDLGEQVVVDEVYPYPLPDLFAGEQLVVVGRYRAGGVVPVTLRGVVNGREFVNEYASQELVDHGGEPFVARLWAARKIGVLMTQIRREGPDPEVIDAIVDLSLQYGIVTPYTTYLVEEPQMQPQAGQPEAPLMPDGSAPSGMGGGAGGAAAAPAAGAVPTEVRPEAEAAAAAEADRVANMAASGEEAVAASKAQNEMQTATTVSGDEAMVFVEGKTFMRQGYVTGTNGETLGFWVDTAYTSDMEMGWVLFGSDAYFALVQEPRVAAWLAVSPELVVVLGDGRAVRVTTSEEAVAQHPAPAPAPAAEATPQPPATPEAPAAPDATATPEAGDSGGWGAFWLWLWDAVTP
jgi:Ca-activated chloride channel family protein